MGFVQLVGSRPLGDVATVKIAGWIALNPVPESSQKTILSPLWVLLSSVLFSALFIAVPLPVSYPL